MPESWAPMGLADSWFLQVIEAVANVVLGFVLMLAIEGFRLHKMPQFPYLVSGGLQVSAKYFTTQSMVAGVSFPVATLAKSSKMVPVLIGQLLLGSAKYTTREYLNVALIVAGTGLVSMAGKSKAGKQDSLMGLLCLIGSLACDGTVAGAQKSQKKKLKESGLTEKNFEMQFLTNFYMTLTALGFAAVFQEFGPAMEFILANPVIFTKIVLFAACSAVGQAFIFFVISEFDSLVCSTVTTTRKIFSVLLSVFTKGHSMNAQGWSGIGLACLGILSELEDKFSKSGEKSKEKTK
ncbi:unnamed protein product [Prorocentrum cordatum]|uniref:Solute carrier family 35 member B1 n=2 Tax=Prorocentrum cordatum TaxID=2364126 RepID=A0ABN9RKM6_9DINO|nr:unnamed protein product [Polarella glacialis]